MIDEELIGGELEQAARLFNALGSRLRLRILLLLSSTDRPLHIKAVSRRLKVSYPTIYRHVKVLRNAGLVKVYEVGRSRVIALANPQLLKNILAEIKALKT